MSPTLISIPSCSWKMSLKIVVIISFIIFSGPYLNSSPWISSDPGALSLLNLKKLFCTSSITIGLFSGLASPWKGPTWDEFGSLNFYSIRAAVNFRISSVLVTNLPSLLCFLGFWNLFSLSDLTALNIFAASFVLSISLTFSSTSFFLMEITFSLIAFLFSLTNLIFCSSIVFRISNLRFICSTDQAAISLSYVLFRCLGFSHGPMVLIAAFFMDFTILFNFSWPDWFSLIPFDKLLNFLVLLLDLSVSVQFIYINILIVTGFLLTPKFEPLDIYFADN